MHLAWFGPEGRLGTLVKATALFASLQTGPIKKFENFNSIF